MTTRLAAKSTAGSPAMEGTTKSKTGGKFRKLLGTDVDEKQLVDPMSMYRAHVLKNGYAIPDAFANCTAEDLDPVSALVAYRELPDINAQWEPNITLPGISPSTSIENIASPPPTTTGGTVKERDSSRSVSGLAGTLKFGTKKSSGSTANLFTKIGGTLRSKSQERHKEASAQALEASRDSKEDSGDGKTAEAKSNGTAVGIPQRALTPNELTPIAEAFSGKSLQPPGTQQRYRSDICIRLENINVSVTFDLEFFVSLYDRGKGEFITYVSDKV
jgi:hypothetical protein